MLNGFDPGYFFYRDIREARRNPGLSLDAKIILYVGRLSKAKGLQELCDAFAILARDQSNLRLVCLGSGPFQENILSAARAGQLGRHGLPCRAIKTAMKSRNG